MIPRGRGSGLLATTACRLAESVASSQAMASSTERNTLTARVLR